MFYNVFKMLLIICVVAEEFKQKHRYKKHYSKGFVCNYEVYRLTTLQYVLYTCVHESNCVPNNTNPLVRFPELDFDNCNEMFHFSGRGRYVCCHPADNQETKVVQYNADSATHLQYMPGFRSAFKCNVYSKLHCLNEDDCPENNRQRRHWTKGRDVRLGTFPYLALIGWYDNQTNQQDWFCVGSIISERYVLSVHSCVMETARRYSNFIRVGEENICKVGVNCPISAYAQEIPVEKTFFHPNSLAYFYNDLGLFKTAKEITFNKHVRPACIFYDMVNWHDSAKFVAYDPVTEEERGQRPKAGSVEITPHVIDMNISYVGALFDDCKREYAFDTRLLNGVIDQESMFCAKYNNDAPEHCEYHFDDEFGGAVVVRDYAHFCTWKVLGVMGWFQTAGNCVNRTHLIFTRVTYFLEWIENYAFEDFNMLTQYKTDSGHCYDTKSTVPTRPGICTAN